MDGSQDAPLSFLDTLFSILVIRLRGCKHRQYHHQSDISSLRNDSNLHQYLLLDAQTVGAKKMAFIFVRIRFQHPDFRRFIRNRPLPLF